MAKNGKNCNELYVMAMEAILSFVQVLLAIIPGISGV
jgi:hypothetical protein